MEECYKHYTYTENEKKMTQWKLSVQTAGSWICLSGHIFTRILAFPITTSPSQKRTQAKYSLKAKGASCVQVKRRAESPLGRNPTQVPRQLAWQAARSLWLGSWGTRPQGCSGKAMNSNQPECSVTKNFLSEQPHTLPGSPTRERAAGAGTQDVP